MWHRMSLGDAEGHPKGAIVVETVGDTWGEVTEGARGLDPEGQARAGRAMPGGRRGSLFAGMGNLEGEGA